MKPYFRDGDITIYCADCKDILPLIPDRSIDLIVTDPPYGISFMGKDWDKVLPDKKIWFECFRVLKDGAFAFVMSIPRADCLSRMIISLEDAGFRVGFTPIFWAYASGFPKAQNIGKAVDKRLGAERKQLVTTHQDIFGEWDKPEEGKAGLGKNRPAHNGGFKPEYNLFLSATPQAKALDGSYGGFQPKPAVEVIIVAMKPLSEKTYVDQALKNRKGITWLDDGRIPIEKGDEPYGGYGDEVIGLSGFDNKKGAKWRLSPTADKGRFTANLLVSDDVLNIESGGAFAPVKSGQKSWGGKIYGKFASGGDDGKSFFGDTGSFSRYFDLDKWFEEKLKELPASVQKTFPFLIVPKASKSEKNKGLDYEPQPIVGRDEGQDIRNVPQKARSTPRINQHPTVKPLKLMSYLITLGSREGDIVLDPFVGSGTTALASQLLSRKSISIEIEEKYCEIAVKRLAQGVMNL